MLPTVRQRLVNLTGCVILHETMPLNLCVNNVFFRTDLHPRCCYILSLSKSVLILNLIYCYYILGFFLRETQASYFTWISNKMLLIFNRNWLSYRNVVLFRYNKINSGVIWIDSQRYMSVPSVIRPCSTVLDERILFVCDSNWFMLVIVINGIGRECFLNG